MDIKFIKLNSKQPKGTVYHINPVFIVSISEDGELCRVKTMDGKDYLVNESLNEIMDLIKKSNFITIINK